MEQFDSVRVARPKLERKAQLLTKKQVTERENAACAGGLRNPAAFVRASEDSRRAGAKLRKNMDEIMRQPEVLTAMLKVVVRTEQLCT